MPTVKFNLTVTTGDHGSITPDYAYVALGTSKRFDIIPDPGYRVGEVKIDGEPVALTRCYTFTVVHADHNIAATFVPSDPPRLGPQNLHLLVGTAPSVDDIIDRVDAGTLVWGQGEHGDGPLECDLVTDTPHLPISNGLVRGAVVRLMDGPQRLYTGNVSQVVATSDGCQHLSAVGVLIQAQNDPTFVATFVDSAIENWHGSESASKMFTIDEDGKLRVKHEKGHAVEADNGAGIWYWLNNGLRADQEIDHVLFDDSTIDVDSGTWFAEVQFNDGNPWEAWTASTKTWNHTIHTGSVRVPHTGSFRDAGHAGVQCLRVYLYSSVDLSAADSNSNRWITLQKPQVFTVPGETGFDEPTADEAMCIVAQELGVEPDDCVQVTVGDPLGSLAILDATDRSDALAYIASRCTALVEWRFRAGRFYVNPSPLVPVDRTRWFVVDSANDVIEDDETKVEYVCATYRCWRDADLPDGKLRRFWYPEEPADALQRVAPLSLTEGNALTEGEVEDICALYLAMWQASATQGAVPMTEWVQTIDGAWFPSRLIMPGDFLNITDRGIGPFYITGVESTAIAPPVVHVGGSERDWEDNGKLIQSILDIAGHRKRRRHRRKKKARRRKAT